MNSASGSLVVGEVIGSGYFADVCIGEDPVHGKVAVKVLRRADDELDEDWEERKRQVVTEGRHLSEATHERIVRVFYADNSLSSPSLVMELCAGSLLPLYKAGPIPLLATRDAVSDAVAGLSILHARGMIHRDIKPSNILLDERGRAKLADFGLVTDRLVLGYGSRAGYLDHLAPEAFEEGGRTSVSSDVWAVGMTTYRLLHGDRWYQEEIAVSPRLSVQKGSFAKKLPWLPHIPDAWRRLVRRAMHDDPSRRFASADALLNAIARVPVSPLWNCVIEEERVVWSRRKSDRVHEVEWNRKWNDAVWTAWSVDVATSTRRQVASGRSVAGLEAFFGRAK